MIVAMPVAPGDIILFELHDDEQRRDLGDVSDIAGDEDHRAIFADGSGEGEREAGEQRRRQGRQHHTDDGLQPARAESGGGLLQLHFEFRNNRLHGAHDERQADEDERDQNAPAGEGDLDVVVGERRAEPAIRRIQRRKRNAGDGRRQREGQIDEGVEQSTAGKIVSGEHPGDDEAKEQIDDRRREGDEEGRAQRAATRGSEAIA